MFDLLDGGGWGWGAEAPKAPKAPLESATGQYTLHQGKNRARIETCNQYAVCLKSSGVR